MSRAFFEQQEKKSWLRDALLTSCVIDALSSGAQGMEKYLHQAETVFRLAATHCDTPSRYERVDAWNTFEAFNYVKVGAGKEAMRGCEHLRSVLLAHADILRRAAAGEAVDTAATLGLFQRLQHGLQLANPHKSQGSPI